VLHVGQTRAAFWFAARTLSRHRGHRLLLGLYIGLALACALWSLSGVIYGGQFSEVRYLLWEETAVVSIQTLSLQS
jgi:hypothetical protein